MTEAALTIEPDRRPAVIVDQLHVKYRAYGSGKVAKNAKAGLLARTRRGIREVHALNDAKRRGVLGLHADYQDIWMRVFQDGARQGVLRAMSKIEVKAILGMYFYSFLWIKGDGAMAIDAIAEDFAGITLRAAGKG